MTEDTTVLHIVCSVFEDGCAQKYQRINDKIGQFLRLRKRNKILGSRITINITEIF